MQQATQVPEIGQAAPEFKLRGPGGQSVSLSDYQGSKNVVLVFYPLAFSPVCSHQLPLIEKELAKFEKLDAVVLGVSVDSHYANEAYARHLGLSFPLLSDFNRKTSAAYGVLNPERGYSGRAVFVIDRRGKLIYKEVSPVPGDVSQIPSNERALEALRGLS